MADTMPAERPAEQDLAAETPAGNAGASAGDLAATRAGDLAATRAGDLAATRAGDLVTKPLAKDITATPAEGIAPIPAEDFAADRPDRPDPALDDADDGWVDQAHPVGRDWRLPVSRAAWVLVIYLFTRLVQLMILSWQSAPGTKLKDRLLAWDGGWWIRVATEGYPHGYTYDDQGHMVGNALAFFPLYPSLIKLLSTTGLSAGTAALVIAWVAAAVACLLLFQLAMVISGGNSRVGFALVVLFCTQPMSIVLSMGYSESLFLALVIGALLACWYDKWLLAGLLACAAGLTRPTGAAVALAVLAGAVVAVARRRAGWTALAGAVIGVLGVPAYLLWVGLRVGHLDAWFQIQTAGWGTTTDFGTSTVDFVEVAMHQGEGWVQMSVAFLLIAVVVSAVVAIVRRTWLPLAVYGVVALGLVIGQAGYYHSKPRLLVPVLLTLVPVAYAAARARIPAAVLGLTAYALFGMWYSAYMLAVWHYTI
jgi:hypothetical protein